MPFIFPASTQPRNHLIVPDEHAYPGDNLRRFEWLGEYIMDTQPEVIIRLGDIWDMPSLCSYDKGKKSFVFKNVKDDLEAGHKAEKTLFKSLIKFNNSASKNKKAMYRPLIYKFLGNHEARVEKLLSLEPRWEGSVSMNDFRTRLNINEHVTNYLDFAVIDNIAYSHLFVSGTMGRPAASARAMLQKKNMSCTMGHTHVLDHAISSKPTGELCRALVAGSFHDPDYSSFAGTQVDLIWWNGVLMKHGVLNGSYDLEEVNIKRLQRAYS